MNSSAIAGRARRRISRSREAASRSKLWPQTRSPPTLAGVCERLSAAFGQALERKRIDAVLDLKHACGELLGRVAGEHRHARLFDDWARIEVWHDEVHRGAVLLRSGRKCALMSVESLEGGQERRMDVNQAPIPSFDEPRAEYA